MKKTLRIWGTIFVGGGCIFQTKMVRGDRFCRGTEFVGTGFTTSVSINPRVEYVQVISKYLQLIDYKKINQI